MGSHLTLFSSVICLQMSEGVSDVLGVNPTGLFMVSCMHVVPFILLF